MVLRALGSVVRDVWVGYDELGLRDRIREGSMVVMGLVRGGESRNRGEGA